MKFKNFLLLEDNRSKPIDREEAERIINTKCKASLKGTPIYRKVLLKDNFYIVDPSKFVRKSANTKNYYTLLIDYILPEWKNYPKRSRSLVATTSEKILASVFYKFQVFPFDGSKIGVCPKDDIWLSFIKSLGGWWLDDFNKDLESLGKLNNIKLSETDPNLLKKQIQSLKRTTRYQPEIKIFKKWMKNEKLDLLKLIEEALDPNKNGFKLVKAGDKIPFDKEVWTDGVCILKRI